MEERRHFEECANALADSVQKLSEAYDYMRAASKTESNSRECERFSGALFMLKNTAYDLYSKMELVFFD